MCGYYLLQPLSDDPSITYLRLPMCDNLGQNLSPYLQHALCFIADGLAAGHSTLVHCNAGRLLFNH